MPPFAALDGRAAAPEADGNTAERLGAALLALAPQADACLDMGALQALSARTVALAGMTAIASGMLTGPRVAAGSAIHFHTWSDEWAALYQARALMDIDPLPRWALLSGSPARWTDIIAALPAQDPGRMAARLARDFGYLEGVVVPMRSRWGQLGLVAIGGSRADLDTVTFEFLVGVAAILHRRADALDWPNLPTSRRLSRRERECVILLTQGLTEREIADQLHISEVTARFHLDNARTKTGARSRTHLAGIAGLWLSGAGAHSRE